MTAPPPPYVLEPFEALPRRDGTDVVVMFHGELDLAGVPRVARVMRTVGGVLGARVVLDLSDLSFIDASGIGAMERARDQMARQGRQVIVRDPQPAVRRVLELCGLEGWLEPRGEPERAVAPAADVVMDVSRGADAGSVRQKAARDPGAVPRIRGDAPWQGLRIGR